MDWFSVERERERERAREREREANADTSRKDKNTDRFAWYLLLSKRRGGSVGW